MLSENTKLLRILVEQSHCGNLHYFELFLNNGSHEAKKKPHLIYISMKYTAQGQVLTLSLFQH